MKVSLFVDDEKFCLDFELESNWLPSKDYSYKRVGTISMGFIKLPEYVRGAVGKDYTFKISSEKYSTVEFNGHLRKTSDGENYIEITHIYKEEL